MINQPLVSIIMACYNAEDFLEYSLLSIGQQRYQNIQVIFVDDGSKDDSVAIARKFLSSPQHKIIELGENKGIGAALNSGLAAADGEIMARFDADDYMYEYRIRDQVDALLEDKNLDLIGSGADLIGISTGKLHPPTDYNTIKNTLLVNNPFIHPTITFKRRLFDQGIYKYNIDLRAEEDYELWCRIVPHINARNMRKCSIKYRIHEGNNQRHPEKMKSKMTSISYLLNMCGADMTNMVEALACFQCSGFITADQFSFVQAYARKSETNDWPKLGWLQNLVLKSRNYAEFITAVRI